MIIAKCENVTKHFPIRRGYLRGRAGYVRAVDGVSIEIEKGASYGLVGESASGKTTLGKLMLGILKPDSGRIFMATKRLQVIFQDPHSSLDPKMKVRDIISEGLIVRKEYAGMDDRVKEMLDLVKLPPGSLGKYPHQFSGGERQRIAIARALVTNPEFIVCDEPVSNLDVTIQLAILKLLKGIKERFSITYLFISHDLKIIKYMCDRVAVMKEGSIVEDGPTGQIYSAPRHPYTKLLLSSILGIYPLVR